MEIDLQVQQGWQCPICKKVYSPTTIMCLYCGDTKYNTSADTQPVINMPNIVDGLAKNIMVNYCDKK